MALYYELPVYKDVYAFTKKIYIITGEFPREYKYTIGQDLKRDCLELVRCIYNANKAKDKTVFLEKFLESFELIKFELRLCKDFKIITTKQIAEFAQLMDSIGKQVTAWRNANSNIKKSESKS